MVRDRDLAILISVFDQSNLVMRLPFRSIVWPNK